MKIYKRIIVTFVSAILTVMLVYGGYTIYALGQYAFQGQPFLWSAKLIYQRQMNDFFNEKTTSFLAIYKADPAKAFEDPRMKSPELEDPSDLKKAREKCMEDKKNLTVYCVSVQALDMYIAYRSTLENIRANIPPETLIQAQSIIPIPGGTPIVLPGVSTVVTPTLTVAMEVLNIREQAIGKEIENARKELEAVVAVYDQFLFNWPIHVKLNETKKELITYKNKLKKIRQKIERFPGKFVDATSTKCE